MSRVTAGLRAAEEASLQYLTQGEDEFFVSAVRMLLSFLSQSRWMTGRKEIVWGLARQSMRH